MLQFRYHWTVLSVISASIAGSSSAHAFQGECMLEVDGVSYLNGSCNIELERDGSFSIGTGDLASSEYFAYVFLSAEAPDIGEGMWNGEEATSHAHEPLGNLARRGGCWVNDRAKVCAWRKGTRPR